MHPKHRSILAGNGDKNKSKSKKTSLRDVLDAATALTAIGDSDDGSRSSFCLGDELSDVEGVRTKKSLDDLEPSVEKDEADEKEDEELESAREKKKGGSGGYQPTRTFPEKLMDMLSADNVSHAAAWNPDGKSFAISNPKKLTEDVLPRFFKHAKFESFVRKLYRWGFRQAEKQDVGQMTFYHKHFQKGKVKLAVSKLRSNTPAKSANMASKPGSVFGVGPSTLGAGKLGADGLHGMSSIEAQLVARQQMSSKLLDISAMARGKFMPPLSGTSATPNPFLGACGASNGGLGGGSSSGLDTQEILRRLLSQQTSDGMSCSPLAALQQQQHKSHDQASIYDQHIRLQVAKLEAVKMETARRDLELQTLIQARRQLHQQQQQVAAAVPPRSHLDTLKAALLMQQHSQMHDMSQQPRLEQTQSASNPFGQTIVQDAIDALRHAS